MSCPITRHCCPSPGLRSSRHRAAGRHARASLRPSSSPTCIKSRRRPSHVQAQKLGEKNSTEVDPQDKERRRQMEDELKDPKNFVEYFLPRQLRLWFFGGSAVGCFLATLTSVSRVVQESARFGTASGAQDVIINLCGLAAFAGLFYWDQQSAQKRVERRKQVRDAQIAFGDREVFTNDEGEKMSRLKEVNDEWILRRLERWGKKDGMPFIGPAKGRLLQELVRAKAPKLAVEVGTMAGYSAILIAQALPRDGRLVSMEKELSWVLVAKRFMWQAGSGSGAERMKGKVDVQWGDAKSLLARLPADQRIDLLFLDGTPKEYLEYLKAAEPHLAKGALVVADNAGVFAQGGLKPYLEYVRSSTSYSSRFQEMDLEWQQSVKDGMEISEYLGS